MLNSCIYMIFWVNGKNNNSSRKKWMDKLLVYPCMSIENIYIEIVLGMFIISKLMAWVLCYFSQFDVVIFEVSYLLANRWPLWSIAYLLDRNSEQCISPNMWGVWKVLLLALPYRKFMYGNYVHFVIFYYYKMIL